MRSVTLFALLLSFACSGDQTSTTQPGTTQPVTSPGSGGETTESGAEPGETAEPLGTVQPGELVEAGDPVETRDPNEAPVSPEPSGELVIGTDECVSDADCVPSDCCHAAACVAVSNAPSCADAMCTQDCRYGTLDCGGGCLCHGGLCAARLSETPAAIRESMEQPQ